MMTTTLTRSIELEIADAADLLTVLKQNYSTWSSGLSPSDYAEYLKRQLAHPWARKNYRYLIARLRNEIVSSCKLYTFDFLSKGEHYKIGGIGAVFTPDNLRGRGYANEMLKVVSQRAFKEDYDGLLLYSDVDPSFYERLGFELLPDNDFHIWTNTPEFERWVMSGPGFIEDMQSHAPDVTTVSREFGDEMVCHYQRYLPTLPYGLVRTNEYWDYKLERMLFRCDHIADYPALEMLRLEGSGRNGGYAIFEQGGKILRVLEVVGGEESREILWRHIFRTALLRRIHLVRGWEGTAPDYPRHVRYTERSDWARPMLMPINQALESWLEYDCCPLLELDHF